MLTEKASWIAEFLSYEQMFQAYAKAAAILVLLAFATRRKSLGERGWCFAAIGLCSVFLGAWSASGLPFIAVQFRDGQAVLRSGWDRTDLSLMPTPVFYGVSLVETIALLAWLAVALAFILKALMELCSIRGIVKYGDDLSEQTEIARISAEVALQVGLGSVPRVLVSDAVTRPMTCGTFWQTVVLPISLLNSASPETLRVVLTHEFVHVVRRDPLRLALASCLHIVFCMVPFARTCFVRYKAAIEQATNLRARAILGLDEYEYRMLVASSLGSSPPSADVVNAPASLMGSPARMCLFLIGTFAILVAPVQVVFSAINFPGRAYIVYRLTDKNGVQQIVRSRLDGSQRVFVTNGTLNATMPDISRDGRSVVYVQSEPYGESIMEWREGSASPRKLSGDLLGVSQPAISPHGDFTVFQVQRKPGPKASVFDLFKVDAESAKLSQLTSGAGAFEPRICPDGKNIVFRTSHLPLLKNGLLTIDWRLGAKDSDIYEFDLDSETCHKLTAGPGQKNGPAVGGRGTWLTYNSNLEGTWETYAMCLGNGQIVRVSSLRSGPGDESESTVLDESGVLVAYTSQIWDARRSEIHMRDLRIDRWYRIGSPRFSVGWPKFSSLSKAR